MGLGLRAFFIRLGELSCFLDSVGLGKWVLNVFYVARRMGGRLHRGHLGVLGKGLGFRACGQGRRFEGVELRAWRGGIL